MTSRSFLQAIFFALAFFTLAFSVGWLVITNSPPENFFGNL